MSAGTRRRKDGRNPAGRGRGPGQSAPKTQDRRARRPVRAIVAGVLLAAGVGAALVLPPAWRETQRREAYLPQLEAMARRDPHDGRLLALLGARQIQADEAAPAAQSLGQALADGEKTVPVWLNLAAAQAAAGEPRGDTTLQAALRQTNSPDMAAALARRQALPPTASGSQVAQALCPQGPAELIQAYGQGSFLNGLAEWWGRRHPEQSGFATRQDWAAEQPDDADAQRLWAEALLENRRSAEAAPVLQHVLALAPASADVHLDAARWLESQGQAPQAALEYVTCLKLRPDWLPALLGLGRSLLTVHLPLTASKVYAEATRVAPDSGEAWVGLGQATTASTGFVDALQPFTTAARIAPGRTDYFDSYAECLSTAGRWGDAEAVLRRRLGADPDDAKAHLLLGSILLHFQSIPARAQEAEAETRTALRLSPGLPAAQQQMADISLAHDQPRDAIAFLQPLLTDTRPDLTTPAGAGVRTRALLTLARAQQRLGLTAQANRTFAQAAAFTSLSEQIIRLKTHEGMTPLDLGIHQQLVPLFARAGQSEQSRQEQQTIALIRASSKRPGQEPETLEQVVEDVLPHR